MLKSASLNRGDYLVLRPSLAIAALCAALAVGVSPAWADEGSDTPAKSAQDATSEPTDEDWQFEIAPYAWFTFITGSTTFRDQGTDVNVTFDEIWDQLHMAFMLDTDIRKADFGFFSDLVYTYLWQRQDVGPLTFSSKIRMVIFDFALYYEVAKLNLGSGPSAPRLRLQPFVGGRYLFLAVPTTVYGGPLERRLDPTSNTAAPILGLRGFLDIDDDWNLSFVGDGGGFGVDDLDVTWQAELLGGRRFHFSKLDLNLMIGYKGLGWDHSGGELQADLILHGPVLKLGFEF